MLDLGFRHSDVSGEGALVSKYRGQNLKLLAARGCQ